VLVSYNGPLWELDPVEVVARIKPARRTSALQAPEQQVFSEVGVDETTLRTWLRTNNLALIVSRDVTTRDRADVQQPFNLRVPGGVSTVPLGGKVYDLAHLQIFQGDQVRGYGGTTTPRAGRRVLSQTMHGNAVTSNPANPSGPIGSVRVGLDGSTAAFVPAQRALTWQLTDGAGKAVVRERNWISFQPGEIRTCASCHGINSQSQTGTAAPQNKPEALRQLLTAWKIAH
jgi:mono/diheme cytochrome c family protein